MPKYDFRCTACEHVFEVSRSFSEDASQATCPNDGSSAERLFSPPMDMLLRGRGSGDSSSGARPAPSSHGHGHSHGGHGHSHGPGTAPHSH